MKKEHKNRQRSISIQNCMIALAITFLGFSPANDLLDMLCFLTHVSSGRILNPLQQKVEDDIDTVLL
jgi:hypothetical protein